MNAVFCDIVLFAAVLVSWWKFKCSNVAFAIAWLNRARIWGVLAHKNVLMRVHTSTGTWHTTAKQLCTVALMTPAFVLALASLDHYYLDQRIFQPAGLMFAAALPTR